VTAIHHLLGEAFGIDCQATDVWVVVTDSDEDLHGAWISDLTERVPFQWMIRSFGSLVRR